MATRSKGWGGVVVVWIAAILACVVAYALWQRNQLPRVEPVTSTPAKPRSSAPARPVTVERDNTLKPGERCLAGKYLREIPGGYEDDLRQDWKCRPR